MEKTINISIIIPVYNVEKYLEKCLQSVVKQIDTRVEVIIINDGSTDESPQICERYCKKYENIFLFDQENQGLSMARNNGINRARGRYLLFLDADDFLTEGILKCLEPVLSDVDFVLGKKDLYIENSSHYVKSELDYTQLQGNFNSCEIFQMLSKNNKFWFTVSMLVIKREFLLQNNLYFIEGIYHEDEMWVPLVFCKSNSFKIIDKSIYFYRIGRSGSITNTLNIKREFDRILIADEYDELIRVQETTKEWKKIFKFRRATVMWIVIKDFKLYENFRTKKELYEQIRTRMNYLKYGRYILGFIGCNMLGITNMCNLNQLRIALINKLYK